jgi:hypothetical protein
LAIGAEVNEYACTSTVDLALPTPRRQPRRSRRASIGTPAGVRLSDRKVK